MKLKHRAMAQKQPVRGPNLAVFSRERLSFEYAVEKANQENRVIASKEKLNQSSDQTELWGSLRSSECWSGTIAAFVEPGKNLGKFVASWDYKWKRRIVFSVPKEYQNEKDVIIFTNHPDFSLQIDRDEYKHHRDQDILITPEKAGLMRRDFQGVMCFGREGRVQHKFYFINNTKVHCKVRPVICYSYGGCPGWTISDSFLDQCQIIVEAL